MPKKRFTSQYSKPASTVHPSLNSPITSGSSSQNHQNASPKPTVNDLLSSFRKSSITPQQQAHALATSSLSPSPHTLPPQIRHLLSQPEAPSPQPRRPGDRARRFDANGRRIPAGPAPPRSWLEGSIHAPAGVRSRYRARLNGNGGKGEKRLYPDDVGYFPGLPNSNARGSRSGSGMSGGRSLMENCLRSLAMNWEKMSSWERNNLAGLPTRIRIMILSFVAVYGPEQGVGYQALRDLLVSPFEVEGKTGKQADTSGDGDGDGQTQAPDWEWEEQIDGKIGDHLNDDFFRLDLAGSIGRSISLKQLGSLVTAKDNNLSPPLPHLTHLSLSHPPKSISWPKLLVVVKDLRALTHLSLAYWPAPSLTPNSDTTVFCSTVGGWRDVQYGASNFYSRTLDGDWSEGAGVLKRLATGCYGLEYLDLEGCGEWIRALRVRDQGIGVEWGRMWVKLKRLVLVSGRKLEGKGDWEDVKNREKEMYMRQTEDALGTGRFINKERKKNGLEWVDVVVDPEIEGARVRVVEEFQPNVGQQPGDDGLNTVLVNSAWDF